MRSQHRVTDFGARPALVMCCIALTVASLATFGRADTPPEPMPVPDPVIFNAKFLKPNDQEYVANDLSVPVHILLSYANFTRGSTVRAFHMSVSANCMGTSRTHNLANLTVPYATEPDTPYDYYDDVHDIFVHRCLDEWIAIQARVWADEGTSTKLVGYAYTEVHVISNRVSMEYIACACISILCCLALIYLYIRFPALRRFPSNLVFWRTLCDLVFAVQFVWINSWEFSWDDASPDGNTNDKECNVAIAFITQFSMMASLCWYFVLSLNAYFSISNPFRMPQHKTEVYHIGTWSAAGGTAVLTLWSANFRQDYRICWFAKRQGLNVYNWIGFFIWLILFMIISVGILIWAAQKLKTPSLERTLSTRRESLQQTQIYVLVFTLYWAVVGGIWGAVFFGTSGDPNEVIQDRKLSYVFALAGGLMGFCDSVTWAFIQRKAIVKAWTERNGVKDDAASNPSSPRSGDQPEKDFDDISDALRYEFIWRTQEGIQAATQQEFRAALKKANDTPIPRSAAASAAFGRSPKPGIGAAKGGGRSNGDGGDGAMSDADAAALLTTSVSALTAQRAAELSSRLLAEDRVDDWEHIRHLDSETGGSGVVHHSLADSEDQPPGEAESIDVVNIITISSSAPQTAAGAAAQRRGTGIPGGGGVSRAGSVDMKTQQPGGAAPRPSVSGAAGVGGSGADSKRTRSPTFHFKSYYPVIFHTLRNTVFGITNDSYRASMAGAPEDMIKHFSAGASGSFFYLSVDQRYMIKTLTFDEHVLLKRIVRRYCRYMNSNRRSLICKFYGLYSIELYGHTEYVVVMNNFLRTPMDQWGTPLYQIDEIFDLKGSTINRHSKKKKQRGSARARREAALAAAAAANPAKAGFGRTGSTASRGTLSKPLNVSVQIGGAGGAESGGGDDAAAADAAPAPIPKAHKPSILKDNDLNQTVRVSSERAEFLIRQITSDSQFLRDQNIMDYSLLLGIHNCTERRHTDRHCNALPQPVKNRPSVFFGPSGSSSLASPIHQRMGSSGPFGMLSPHAQPPASVQPAPSLAATAATSATADSRIMPAAPAAGSLASGVPDGNGDAAGSGLPINRSVGGAPSGSISANVAGAALALTNSSSSVSSASLADSLTAGSGSGGSNGGGAAGGSAAPSANNIALLPVSPSAAAAAAAAASSSAPAANTAAASSAAASGASVLDHKSDAPPPQPALQQQPSYLRGALAPAASSGAASASVAATPTVVTSSAAAHNVAVMNRMLSSPSSASNGSGGGYTGTGTSEASELEGSGVAADVIVGPGIYHIGIIDVLQRWSWQKKAEQWTKRFLRCYCQQYTELSAVEPGYYSDRFTGMIQRLFEPPPPY